MHSFSDVMPVLDTGIHPETAPVYRVDCRVKPGNDHLKQPD